MLELLLKDTGSSGNRKPLGNFFPAMHFPQGPEIRCVKILTLWLKRRIENYSSRIVVIELKVYLESFLPGPGSFG